MKLHQPRAIIQLGSLIDPLDSTAFEDIFKLTSIWVKSNYPNINRLYNNIRDHGRPIQRVSTLIETNDKNVPNTSEIKMKRLVERWGELKEVHRQIIDDMGESEIIVRILQIFTELWILVLPKLINSASRESHIPKERNIDIFHDLDGFKSQLIKYYPQNKIQFEKKATIIQLTQANIEPSDCHTNTWVFSIHENMLYDPTNKFGSTRYNLYFPIVL